jgi:hypothetical protein
VCAPGLPGPPAGASGAAHIWGLRLANNLKVVGLAGAVVPRQGHVLPRLPVDLAGGAASRGRAGQGRAGRRARRGAAGWGGLEARVSAGPRRGRGHSWVATARGSRACRGVACWDRRLPAAASLGCVAAPRDRRALLVRECACGAGAGRVRKVSPNKAAPTWKTRRPLASPWKQCTAPWSTNWSAFDQFRPSSRLSLST